MELSRKPQVLYRASIERITSAHRTFETKDYPLSMYLSGLAVECVLQAVALHHGAIHDARHSLLSWLANARLIYRMPSREILAVTGIE